MISASLLTIEINLSELNKNFVLLNFDNTAVIYSTYNNTSFIIVQKEHPLIIFNGNTKQFEELLDTLYKPAPKIIRPKPPHINKFT